MTVVLVEMKYRSARVWEILERVKEPPVVKINRSSGLWHASWPRYCFGTLNFFDDIIVDMVD